MLKPRLERLYRQRGIVYELSKKQLLSRYAGSKLGIWWAVAMPLIMAISINFVFAGAFKIKTPRFAFFVLAGIIPWFFFQNALSESMNSFCACRDILKQAIFPREFIPAASVIVSFLIFLIGLLFLLPLFVILNFAVIKFLPILLLVAALEAVFVLGLGLVLSCLNVFLKDLSHVFSITLMIWFWVTPVFYSIDMLGQQYKWVCVYNPMTYYIACYQQILFYAAAPTLTSLGVIALISIVSITAGYAFFCKLEPRVLKLI